MSSCGKKKNTETVAQYRKRCGGRPLGMIQKVSEEHTCHDCGQPIDINEAGFKFVIRNKKKIKKLICPPGTKCRIIQDQPHITAAWSQLKKGEIPFENNKPKTIDQLIERIWSQIKAINVYIFTLDYI